MHDCQRARSSCPNQKYKVTVYLKKIAIFIRRRHILRRPTGFIKSVLLRVSILPCLQLLRRLSKIKLQLLTRMSKSLFCARFYIDLTLHNGQKSIILPQMSDIELAGWHSVELRVKAEDLRAESGGEMTQSVVKVQSWRSEERRVGKECPV